MGMHVLDMVVLVVYFGGMILVGLYFAQKNKSTEEYFLGNRAFSGWVIGLSLLGTSISSVSFLAFPADAFKTTWLRLLPCFMLIPAALAGAYIFMPFYRRTKATSAFEYLEARFGPTSRMYGAVAFILGQIFRLSTILFLLAGVVHELTGTPYWVSILIGGLFVSFYTVAGGIEAVVWTDVVQSIVLIFGGLLVLFKIITLLPGGIGEIFSVASEADKFALADMENGVIKPVSWKFSISAKTAMMMFVVGLMAQMTEHACDQNIVQRYCATKSMHEARKALLICVLMSVPIWIYFYFVGTSLYVFYEAFPADKATAMYEGAEKAELILPFFVLNYLPIGLSGLVLAAVVAAAMSSLDSNINAISTVTVVDFYKRHMVKDRDDKHYLFIARMVAVVVSVFMIGGAMFFAYTEIDTVQDTITALTAIATGGLLGLYLLGFLTTRGDGNAVGIAILCTIAWSAYMLAARNGLVPDPPIDDYYTGIFGHIIVFVVGFLLAMFIPGKQRDLTNLTVWTQDHSEGG